MKRLTYDYEGRHFCDYPTREIINRLAECEIMLEEIEEMVKQYKKFGNIDFSMQIISGVIANGNDD